MAFLKIENRQKKTKELKMSSPHHRECKYCTGLKEQINTLNYRTQSTIRCVSNLITKVARLKRQVRELQEQLGEKKPEELILRRAD